MSRWVEAALRAVVAIALGVGIGLVPVPLPPWPHVELVKAGLLALLVVIYLGKLLYDTLFYERYRP